MLTVSCYVLSKQRDIRTNTYARRRTWARLRASRRLLSVPHCSFAFTSSYWPHTVFLSGKSYECGFRYYKFLEFLLTCSLRVQSVCSSGDSLCFVRELADSSCTHSSLILTSSGIRGLSCWIKPGHFLPLPSYFVCTTYNHPLRTASVHRLLNFTGEFIQNSVKIFFYA